MTDTCAPTAVVSKTWAYTALQDSPAGPALNGTLLITNQSCGDFEGLLDVVETDGGASRRLAGPVTGTMLDATIARFTVTFGANEREHVARFTADSVTGTWVDRGGSVAYGRFAGSRQVTP